MKVLSRWMELMPMMAVASDLEHRGVDVAQPFGLVGVAFSSMRDTRS